MPLICCNCGRNLNEIGSDNMSYTPGISLCEDCYYSEQDWDAYDECYGFQRYEIDE